MMEMKPRLAALEMERAFYEKETRYDGVFFVAVKTTGIFCRPSCPARPKRENVEFFATMREAIFAGYRPCKRCHPTRVNDAPPGQARNGAYIAAQFIETPLGPLLCVATREGVCFVEFSDRRMLEYNYQVIRKRFKMPILPATNQFLEQLRAELNCYFEGKLEKFQVPLVLCGTPFQERVWNELRKIPYGETISYQELAARIEEPKAIRAAARANGMNRISILVPCHRVVGKDGELTGYGGGLWRKRLLLELERTGAFAGSIAS